MANHLGIKKLDLENGETLAYREVGNGNHILLLVHGNMCSGIHFLPTINRLPPDFKAYLVDLRGFGDSTYHRRIDSIKELSDDLFAFVNKLGIKNFTIVGWSAGGSVCLQFGADYPDIVKKIVLIESVGYTGCPLFKKDEQGKILTGQVYKDREEMAEDPEVAPCLQAIKNQDFHDMSILWDRAIYSNRKPLPEDNQLYINATLKQRNLVDIYWALALFNMSNKHNGYTEGNNRIKEIKAPVLSFWGEKDLIIPEDAARETVEALGNKAELVILKDSGHSPFIDCPDVLMPKIAGFIL
jgi:pimeloyl-ACP methyl ester carboxylesterase